MTVAIHTLGIDTIQMIDQEIHRIIDIEIIPTIETEATRIIESTISKQSITRFSKIFDSEKKQTTSKSFMQ